LVRGEDLVAIKVEAELQGSRRNLCRPLDDLSSLDQEQPCGVSAFPRHERENNNNRRKILR